MDMSIIIVNYNTCQLTLNTIQSVLASQTGFSYEIIVVDNNSTDHTIKAVELQFPQVQIIPNTDNLGFSKANNQGIRLAQGRYILLLNSDTIVQPDTLDVMTLFMDNHPHIGASGCKIVLPDGSLDKACKRGFPTPWNSFCYAFGLSKLFPQKTKFNGYQLGYLDSDKDYPVDSLVGAFMLVRRETIEQIGLLDEQFFMYGEDIDWCYRMKQAGWENYYYPYTQIIHYKGASSRKKPFKIIYEFHRAMYLFHKKHYKNKYSTFINLMVYLGIGLKFLMELTKNRLFQLLR